MRRLPPQLRAGLARLRRFWPEAALVTLMAVPWIALFALGLLWIWQSGAALWWALGAALFLLAGLPLRRVVRRRAAARTAALLARDARSEQLWDAEEQAAWEKVVALAAATEPFGLDGRERAERVLRETVELVARHFHPGRDDAVGRVTVPEALLLAELVARRLRGAVMGHLPLAMAVKLSHLFAAQRLADRHGATALGLYLVAETLWRGARFAANPATGIVQEFNRAAAGGATSFLAGNLQRAATQRLIEETGRAAIELYSGRLRGAANRAGPAEAELPLRALLVGQPNAGKTALLNALAGSLRAEPSPLPGEPGLREHRLAAPGRPPLEVAELPPGDPAQMVREAARADVVLWVVAATQPGRDPDLAGLRALRAWAGQQPPHRAPPVLVVMTRADQLRPKGEWQPPYPPDHAKARSIAEARAAIAEALDLAEAEVVPVALPPGGDPWNIEALWGALLGRLDDARHARFQRLREAAGKFDLGGEARRAATGLVELARAALRRP